MNLLHFGCWWFGLSLLALGVVSAIKTKEFSVNHVVAALLAVTSLAASMILLLILACFSFFAKFLQ